MARDKNRGKVLEALAEGDKSQAQLIEATGLGQATVWRWIQRLLEDQDIHVCKLGRHPHGGPHAEVYRSGPRPKGFRLVRPPKPSDLERTRAYRRKMRASGEWQHTLARRRASYRADNPVRCPLTAGLFGPG